MARAADPQADDSGDDAVSGAARAEQLVSDALQAQVDGQHERQKQRQIEPVRQAHLMTARPDPAPARIDGS